MSTNFYTGSLHFAPCLLSSHTYAHPHASPYVCVYLHGHTDAYIHCYTYTNADRYRNIDSLPNP
jgi:hypothetical protein